MQLSPSFTFTLFTTLIMGLLSVSSGNHLDPPTQAPTIICSGDNSTLHVETKTEEYWGYNDWYLYKLDDNGQWEEVANLDYQSYFIVYYDDVCLEPDSTYKWVIKNTVGDGLCDYTGDCGYANLTLNSEPLFSTGDFEFLDLVTFMTPSDPSGDFIILSDFPSAAPSVDNPCFEDDSWLRIETQTEDLYYNTHWYLYKLDDNGEWDQVADRDFWSYLVYYDNECLDPDSTYKWEIKSSSGKGLCGNWQCSFCPDSYKCGFAKLELNTDQIFYSNGEFTKSEVVIFVTPSDPMGDYSILSNSPSDSPSNQPSVTPTESNHPSNSPTDCDGDTLTIEVHTDYYPYSNSWKLELKDEITNEWSVVRSNDLPESTTLYVDYPCLAEGRLYRWTLTDIYGNGLYCPPFGGQPGDDDCGYYRLTYKGEEIVSPGKFEYHVIKEIGPVECIDYPGTDLIEFDYEDPNDWRGTSRARCKGIARQIRLNSPRISGPYACNITLTDGSGVVADKCKKTCAKYGVGPCAA